MALPGEEERRAVPQPGQSEGGGREHGLAATGKAAGRGRLLRRGDSGVRTKRVLLVDDDEAVLLSLGSYLEQGGMAVETAADGNAALEMLSGRTIDLVVTDLKMEGMDGIALLAEIRAGKFPCGVFILTGEGNLQRAIEALRLGAEDFLLKPCDMEEMLLRMARFFEKQEALRKIRIYEDILPICMYCKKIRDDTGKKWGEGTWVDMEKYLCRTSGTRLSHGCCPECFEKIKSDWLLGER